MIELLPVGRRIAYWRSRRNLTQQVFADRIGKSKSWVDKVERGVRRIDSLSILGEVARVLRVEPALLLDRQTPETAVAGDGSASSGIEAMRSALEEQSTVVGEQAAVRSWDELRGAVDDAWRECEHASSNTRAELLSGLVRDARAAVRHGGDDDSASLLSEVYQLISHSLRSIGEGQLAWLAADRSVTACRDAQNELLFASSIAQVAAALAALDRPRPALDVAVAALARIEATDAVKGSAKALAVYGFLLMQSAMAAAKLGDSLTAESLVSAAQTAAKRLGREVRHYGATFGPVALLLCRVVVHIELGQMARVVATHQALISDGFASLPAERRALHLLDVARAYDRLGDVGEAIGSLAEAGRLAPATVSRHPATAEIMAGSLRRRRGQTGAAALADVAGIPGLDLVR